MINKRDMELSKFISLILRHKPEVIGLKLDKQGYVFVDELLKGMNKDKGGMYIKRFDLDRIVNEDDKKRYSYNNDRGDERIRANQGHSVPVDLGLEEIYPLTKLYHGTGKRFLNSILLEGIKHGARQYVHLSDNIETAIKVGSRHGEVVILEIDYKNMIEDGYFFYRSKNGVYLTDYVETRYIDVRYDLK